ncbi:MAG: choice-of-anchor D domain-containing protein [Acidobacteriia bacterium]|nr:choice-of-anchor D domain-containing protein [Terriglobia bacterium]
MSKFTRVTSLITLMVSSLLTATTWADNLVQVFDQAGQKEDSAIDWSQLGPDQTLLGATATVTTTQGLSATVSFAGPNSVVSIVCKNAPPLAKDCSWTGLGFPAGNRVLWASDAANGGNGPIKVSFANPVLGVGALVQADLPGQFTATLEVFNGSTSLGVFNSQSNSAGGATYLGVRDLSSANITSAVFTLSDCATTCTDFAIDNVHLDANGALVVLSSTALTFPPQLINTSATQQVTVSNPGNALLSIKNITVSGDYSHTNTCGNGIAPGGNCVITVTFTPKHIGDLKGLVDILDNSQDAEHKITLAGTGTADQISPTSLDFGTVVTSASQPVFLTNIGTTTIHILNISFGGDNPTQYSQVNDCNGKIDAGKSCTITVTFTPQFLGPLPATLLISDDGSGGAPQTVTLTGVGSNG